MSHITKTTGTRKDGYWLRNNVVSSYPESPNDSCELLSEINGFVNKYSNSQKSKYYPVNSSNILENSEDNTNLDIVSHKKIYYHQTTDSSEKIENLIRTNIRKCIQWCNYHNISYNFLEEQH
jgi:hypothetical protein